MPINKITFKKLTSKDYNDFLEICNTSTFAPLLLPNSYSSTLWGIIALQDEIVVGGWVGTLRGNKPIVKFITKGVWFDSYPIFKFNENIDSLSQNLIAFAKKQAKKEGITLFNLTHWVRQNIDGSFIDIPEKNATFLIDLRNEEDVLWQNTRKDFKTKVRKKAINVNIFVAKGEEALQYLNIYQELRYKTQKKAISNNSKASMLLRSDTFFTNIIRNTNSIMFLAKFENKFVVANLMIQSGKVLYPYMSGSDTALDNQTGASALLRWEAVKYAKEKGLFYFDLGGVPANPDENHPAYGVYLFKKSMGGEYKEFNGGKIIVSPFKYKILSFLLNNRSLLRFISKNEK